MKHLTITYDGHTIYDGPVGIFAWTENPGGIEVKAEPPKPERPGIMQQLADARTRQTRELVRDKKLEVLVADPVNGEEQ